MRIGIPRALFYYHYYPLWKSFFKNLGHQVVLSSPTNKKIMKQGIEYTVDDACLPVKIYHGHVADLIGKVDLIYIPRIVSIETREFICPKFLGLPDMIQSNIPKLPRVIDVELNLYGAPFALLNHFYKVGRTLGKSKVEVIRAYMVAKYNFDSYQKTLKRYQITPPQAFARIEGTSTNEFITSESVNHTVMVLGHPYNIHDDYLSFDLIKKLRARRVRIITYEMVEDKKILLGAKQLQKPMFWTFGKNILGCAHYFLKGGQIDGIINVASFGCGPDSLVGELLEHKVHRDYDMPFLYLNLDEQSGEAGFNTRIEAFLDILEGRKNHEGNFSTYG